MKYTKLMTRPCNFGFFSMTYKKQANLYALKPDLLCACVLSIFFFEKTYTWQLDSIYYDWCALRIEFSKIIVET